MNSTKNIQTDPLLEGTVLSGSRLINRLRSEDADSMATPGTALPYGIKTNLRHKIINNQIVCQADDYVVMPYGMSGSIVVKATGYVAGQMNYLSMDMTITQAPAINTIATVNKELGDNFLAVMLNFPPPVGAVQATQMAVFSTPITPKASKHQANLEGDNK